MKVKKSCIELIVVLSIFSNSMCDEETFSPSSVDLTIVGALDASDGMGRIPIGMVDMLKDELKVNYLRIPKAPYNLDSVPLPIREIIKNSSESVGNISIFTWPLTLGKRIFSNHVPEKSFIKIAYSMLESTRIPKKWVQILNDTFDLVVIPDEFYRSVYFDSGVNIPIFVLPHGIYIEDFLQATPGRTASADFVFGCNGTLIPRKNQELLIEAFNAEFKNENNVKLKLHGKWGSDSYRNKIEKQMTSLKNPNIVISQVKLTEKECLEFYESLDCYVLLSKGEGFSVTPREALAKGIPCIISDNTAHKTICKSGYVFAVPSELREPADYESAFGKEDLGYQFNCTCADVRKALRAVYNNYEAYKEKAREGRIWVEQYLWKNVKSKFLYLIKPKHVYLGDKNTVTDDCLITTSQALYKKYTALISQN